MPTGTAGLSVTHLKYGISYAPVTYPYSHTAAKPPRKITSAPRAEPRLRGLASTAVSLDPWNWAASSISRAVSSGSCGCACFVRLFKISSLVTLAARGIEEPSGRLLWPEKLNRCRGLGGFFESDPKCTCPPLFHRLRSIWV